MNSTIRWVVIALLFNTACPTTGNSQNALIAGLTTAKIEAEYHIVGLLQQAGEPDKAGTNCPGLIAALDQYDVVKIQSEVMINKLIAYMASKNRLRRFKQADELFRADIENLHAEVVKLRAIKCDDTSKMATFEFAAIAELFYTILSGVANDLSESRGKKIDKVITLLNALKLEKVSLEKINPK